MSVQNYIEALKSVALAEDVKNAQVGDFELSENGFMGQIKFINITGSNKNLHVVLKAAQNQPEVRETIGEKEVFKNEILMYKEINPALQKLQEGIADPFDLAKCYKTSLKPLNEFLILEDLKKSGYATWDFKTPMDRNHVEFTFRQYAKLHASSYALYQRNPEKLQPVIDYTAILNERYVKNDESTLVYEQLLVKLKDEVPEVLKNKAINEKFNRLLENYAGVCSEATTINEVSILCHGDSWCNNMMFKYNEGKLIDMKLIDFQAMKFENPVRDLVNFLYTSTSRDVYDKYKDLLKIYYAALTKHAKALRCEIPMSFKKLMDYWRRFAKLGLIPAFLINKVLLADGEDVEFFGGFNYKSKSGDECRRRMELLIQHCYDNDLL